MQPIVETVLLSGLFLTSLYFVVSRSKSTPLEQYSPSNSTTITSQNAVLSKDLVYSAPPYQYKKTKSINAQTPHLIIGVCGGSGSGKTTLSREIINAFGIENVSYLNHDFYYRDLSHLSIKERAKTNFDHPNSLETSLLIQHLKQLRHGKTVNVPMYDFTTHSRLKETKILISQPIILVEGILLFTDLDLVELMDIKIFVDTAADIRFIRRLQRDMEERNRTLPSVIQQYMTTVRPMHQMYVEDSKKHADIIIPHGANSVALDMILSRLYSFIAIQEE